MNAGEVSVGGLVGGPSLAALASRAGGHGPTRRRSGREASLTAERGHIRVALLHSQQLVREAVCRFLTKVGIEVVGAFGEPADLVASLQSASPHLAIVHVTPSASDSLRTLREAHQARPEVPLLAVSQFADRAVVARCAEAGASGFVDEASSGCEALLAAVRALAARTETGPLELPPSPPRTAVRSRWRTSNDVLRQLSDKERQVLSYLCAGADNLKISTYLGVSERTVKAHVSKLLRKLGKENRTQLALFALEMGVRPPPDL